jgi:AcrR family transcriptional regulator
LESRTAERRASYSSPAILARRQRILDFARVLIGERGYANFNLSDLGARAGVAKQTIYNIFGTKERLIATAINDYFEEREGRIRYVSKPATMERMIERVIVAGRASLSIPHYISALMAIYHAVDTDPDIWAAIHEVGTYPHRAWIESLAERGLLQPWIDPAELIDDLAAQRDLVLLEWCRGKLDDELSIVRKVVGSLTLMAGATRGEARTEVEARLAEILRDGLPRYAEPEGLEPDDRPSVS